MGVGRRRRRRDRRGGRGQRDPAGAGRRRRRRRRAGRPRWPPGTRTCWPPSRCTRTRPAPGKATDEALAEIDRLAALPRVRAVGETGLDRYRTGPEGWAAQEASFRAHIRIAKRARRRAGHPRPGRARRDPPGAGRRGRPRAHRLPLLLRRRRLREGLRRARLRALLRRHADLRQRRRTCARRRRSPRSDQLLVETDAPFLTPDAAPRPAERLPPGPAHRPRARRGRPGVDLDGAVRRPHRDGRAGLRRLGGRPRTTAGRIRPARRETRGHSSPWVASSPSCSSSPCWCPGVLLARAWWLAAGRRAVAGGSRRARRADRRGHARRCSARPQHGRRVPPARPAPRRRRRRRQRRRCWPRRRCSCGCRSSRSGCSLGVLLAEATRPRPRWKHRRPARGARAAAS